MVSTDNMEKLICLWKFVQLDFQQITLTAEEHCLRITQLELFFWKFQNYATAYLN